ncbi:hypothetical protein V8C86DRAFT_2817635, partial [Haematococcus lacustris]
MLHRSILPSHRQFSGLLSGLRYVVLDEGHAYQGVFGAHTALVLRRLRRLCRGLYGSDPLFAVTSATTANPLQHASRLIGVPPEDITLVDQDGSPAGPKHFVLWNPPLTSASKRDRAAGKSNKQSKPPAAPPPASQQGPQPAPRTRTELRATAKVTKRVRAATARAALREANAARHRGTKLSEGSEVWQADASLSLSLAALKRRVFGSPPSKVAAEARDETQETACEAPGAGTARSPGSQAIAPLAPGVQRESRVPDASAAPRVSNAGRAGSVPPLCPGLSAEARDKRQARLLANAQAALSAIGGISCQGGRVSPGLRPVPAAGLPAEVVPGGVRCGELDVRGTLVLKKAWSLQQAGGRSSSSSSVGGV